MRPLYVPLASAFDINLPVCDDLEHRTCDLGDGLVCVHAAGIPNSILVQ